MTITSTVSLRETEYDIFPKSVLVVVLLLVLEPTVKHSRSPSDLLRLEYVLSCFHGKRYAR